LYACRPNTSLVEKSTNRSSVFVAHELRVEDVALDEGEIRMPRELSAAERVAVEVVVDDDLVVVDQPSAEARTDEPRATGKHNSFALKWHAASLVTAFALLAGCGGDGTPSQPATDLEIVVWPNGRSGQKEKATLRCSPAGGTLRDPEAACRQLDALERPFVRPPGDAVCTEIYGGPAVAEIRGTFEGSQLNATFARTDGCEIALWDRHAFLFPVQVEAPPPP
jgi:hypothetical protein